MRPDLFMNWHVSRSLIVSLPALAAGQTLALLASLAPLALVSVLIPRVLQTAGRGVATLTFLAAARWRRSDWR